MKNILSIIVLMICVFLTGCDESPTNAVKTSDGKSIVKTSNDEISEICYDKVVYLLYRAGPSSTASLGSVKYNRDRNIVTCE